MLQRENSYKKYQNRRKTRNKVLYTKQNDNNNNNR